MYSLKTNNRLMKNLLKKLFAPKPTLFKKHDRIKVIKRVGARNAHTDKYVSIESDMVLIFLKDTDKSLIFTVRSNFHPANEYEARDNEIIYFSKKNFKAIKYRKVRQ